MSYFLKKLILFIFIPTLIWGITEALLPITFFTHRHFEAVGFIKVPAKTSMYPNISSSMDAVGDLCFHTKNQIIKHEVFLTDKLGFRNDEFIEEPDILFIGDSFIEGSSLSQDEIISNKVSKKLNGKKVYNMAVSDLSHFDRFLQLGIIKKPKMLIFSIVERDVPELLVLYRLDYIRFIKNAIKAVFSFCDINVYLDKALKHYSINWIQARINNSRGTGVQSKINPKMFFLNGPNQEYNNKNLSTTLDILVSYKSYCDSLGIKFIFLPMPNKETVYFELVPFKQQPNYLLTLDSLLHKSNIQTINTLEVYNRYRKSNSNLLYHFDDTHWNSNATELISKEIVSLVNQNE
jgi:alginate O-acetyltransferase complex protein AlgJ